MRYAQIRKMDVSNGDGIGVSVWAQGCPLQCPSCQNKSVWNFNGGNEWTDEQLHLVHGLIQPDYITRLSILGGEPMLLQNLKDLAAILMMAKQSKPSIKTWLWSGYTFEQLQEKYGINSKSSFKVKKAFRNILYNLDYLIDGPFVLEKKDLSLRWRGSSNQRVIDMQATLRQPVLVGDVIPPIVLDADE